MSNQCVKFCVIPLVLETLVKFFRGILFWRARVYSVDGTSVLTCCSVDRKLANDCDVVLRNTSNYTETNSTIRSLQPEILTY